ncbi:MAG: hypothetical protein ISN26_00685 [Betaproteobacteria bacterium AqS2]|uniref:Uncharacterized protein n=1 Tax=Candidatus Amphirhobacter heronislandensis TaxID=1732024 RepID=A0A930UBN1_9GAMM|nr:hypothetical protein [Betaproteobacteria bacterium AqS2]
MSALDGKFLAWLLPLLGYALLHQVAVAGEPASAAQAAAGALHALVLAAPALLRQRELRRHYVLMLAASAGAGALAFYWHGWPLLFWLCLLAGIGLNAVLAGAGVLQRTMGMLQVLFVLLLLFFSVLPALVGVAGAPGWPDLGALLWGSYAAWAGAYLLTLRAPARPQAEPIICALFFLLLALVALGVALAHLQAPAGGYLETLLRVLLLALALSAGAWVLWSPTIGGGLSTIFFRHVLSINLPIDEWIKEMAALAGRMPDADEFWRQAMEMLLQRTGLAGVGWGEDEAAEVAGSDEGRLTQLPLGESVLFLYSARALPPTRLFSIWLLARVALEFRQSKRREQRLTAEATMKSIHELGAKTTHDIKNILHAINLLCAPRGGGAADGERWAGASKRASGSSRARAWRWPTRA